MGAQARIYITLFHYISHYFTAYSAYEREPSGSINTASHITTRMYVILLHVLYYYITIYYITTLLFYYIIILCNNIIKIHKYKSYSNKIHSNKIHIILCITYHIMYWIPIYYYITILYYYISYYYITTHVHHITTHSAYQWKSSWSINISDGSTSPPLAAVPDMVTACLGFRV